MNRISAMIALCFLFFASSSCPDGRSPEPHAPDGAALSQSYSLRGYGIERLTFAVYEYLPHEAMIEHLVPLINYLSQKFEVPLSLILIRDYKEIERMVENGEADIALLTPLIYVMVREKIPDIQPLVSRIGKEITKYSAYILVRKDSGIHDMEDLRGRKIVFVDEISSSGFLFPYVSCLENGVEPEKFFSRILFSGDHIKSLQMLYDREVDAAATYSGAMRASRLSGVKTGAFKILMKTGRIPNDVVCACKKLHPEAAAAIKNLFLTISSGTEETRDILNNELEINGWIEAGDSLFDPVREKLGIYEASKKKEGNR
ncbi:MAG: phosphate/phosphite/phosphonate ABC transporter substrate-binding protein [Deltaproteobacteria bacterium]|nr:phosphate/phosphite/phosphonate ABC transporter substrate-binding protein [Deltaproteobacteria bacterium]